MAVIGILGVGQLAEYLLRGAAGAGWRFVLSPRGKARAARLAAEFGAEVAASNQAVVDGADMVLVCLPAREGVATLSDLRFRPDQIVLSAMAGAAPRDVADAVAPAQAHCTMMPGHANAFGMGPSLLHPPCPQWRAFLSHLGPVLEMDDPALFLRASAFGAFSGASFALMRQLIDWFTAQGLGANEARALVAGTLKGNAEVLLHDPAGLDEIARGVATPGGITELLVSVLNDRQALSAWEAGMEAVLARLGGGGPGHA